MGYCVANDLYLSFGKVNITKWADLDNVGDNANITNRIDWAISNATNYLDSKLSDSPYQFPLPNQVYPPILVLMTCYLAAVLLYESRGIADVDKNGKGMHALRWHRDHVECFIRDIYARKLDLIGVTLRADAITTSETPDFVSL